MKDSTPMYIGITLVCSVILLVMQWPKKAKPPEELEEAPSVFVTNVSYVKAPLVTQQKPPQLWMQAEADSLNVLLRHIPSPSKIQIEGAREYTFKFYDYREDWIAEAKGIRKDIEDLNNPSVSDSAKTELTRVHEDRWKMMESTVNSMVKGLDESANEFWKRHDITDLNLISDMRALVLPPGKEPWEE